MTTYELTYTNMYGREDSRIFYDKEKAIEWAKKFTMKDDKNLKLIERKEIELTL